MDITEIVKSAVTEAVSPLRAEIGSLKAENDQLKKLIERKPVTDHMKGLMAIGIAPGRARQMALRKSFEERMEAKGFVKALPFMRVCRAVALSKLEGGFKGVPVIEILKQQGFEDHASDVEIHQKALQEKAMSADSLSAGGAMIPDVFAQDFIAVLRPYPVVRSMDPIIVQIDKGNLTIPKGTAPTSAGYVGELVAATESDMSTGQLKLSAKKLIALAAMSNDLIRRSDPNAEEIVLRDLILSIALAEDISFIRGTGVQETPKGIGSLVNANSVIHATVAGSTATLTEVTSQLSQLEGKLQDNNVRLDKERCCYIMHPRSARYIATLRDGVGNYVYKEEIENGMLRGYKLKLTTQIPVNLTSGSGSNQSEVYFASADEMMIGDALTMETTIDPNGTYTAGGSTISGLSTDSTPIRVLSEHDFALRHDVGAAKLDQVQWSA